MCGSKPKAPKPVTPPPPAPAPSKTATGFTNAGDLRASTGAFNYNTRGIDSLRVDLNVPQAAHSGLGVNIP